jgi:hypothetical protein
LRVLDPPDHAIVLSVDEKSQIQALDRTQPGLPMKKGRAGTMTHDYKRHGVTTLFAALNVLEGKVIHRKRWSPLPETQVAMDRCAHAGVMFDNQAFFVLGASREQLAGAIVTITNCSQHATMRAADALAEKTFEDRKARLYERLVKVLEPKIVSKNVEIIGASRCTRWDHAEHL